MSFISYIVYITSCGHEPSGFVFNAQIHCTSTVYIVRVVKISDCIICGSLIHLIVMGYCSNGTTISQISLVALNCDQHVKIQPTFN